MDWRLQRMAIAQLGHMSDHELKDIGLARDEIAAGVRGDLERDPTLVRRGVPRRTRQGQRCESLKVKAQGNGAPGRTRTSTPLRATDFEVCRVYHSATGARADTWGKQQPWSTALGRCEGRVLPSATSKTASRPAAGMDDRVGRAHGPQRRAADGAPEQGTIISSKRIRSAASRTPRVATTVGSGARPNSSISDQERPRSGPMSGWMRSAKTNRPRPAGRKSRLRLGEVTRPAAPAQEEKQRLKREAIGEIDRSPIDGGVASCRDRPRQSRSSRQRAAARWCARPPAAAGEASARMTSPMAAAATCMGQTALVVELEQTVIGARRKEQEVGKAVGPPLGSLRHQSSSICATMRWRMASSG